MSSDGDSEPDVGARIGKAATIFQRLRPICPSTTTDLNVKLRLYTAIVSDPGNLCVWDVEENGHDRSQIRCLSSPLPACNPRHIMARPCHRWRGDEESRHGATPRHCYNKENGNRWPRPQNAERKTSPYRYLLGARRRQKKEGEAE